jgi:predicted ATPase
LCGFVTDLAGIQPLLVVVEDLHWSDGISLEFLPHLARRVAGVPLLLVLTYRDDEVDVVLARFLAGLDRERLASELRVTRLSASDVEAMVRAILALPRPAPADLLHVLFSLTEGNPLFVEEMLKSLLVSGDVSYTDGAWRRRPVREWRIPRSIADAVQRRSAALPLAAQRILTFAAVVGQRFDFALLQDLTGVAEEELLAQIKVLIQAQLLVEESADRFAFRHALGREAVYTQLLGRERRALHRAVAAALARLDAADPDGRVAALAYHTYEAARRRTGPGPGRTLRRPRAVRPRGRGGGSPGAGSLPTPPPFARVDLPDPGRVRAGADRSRGGPARSPGRGRSTR